jgi:hypothetical protein
LGLIDEAGRMTHAQTMVIKLEALLEQNPGAESVTVDGQTVKFADLEARLARYRREVERQAHRRGRAAGIRLGGIY